MKQVKFLANNFWKLKSLIARVKFFFLVFIANGQFETQIIKLANYLNHFQREQNFMNFSVFEFMNVYEKISFNIFMKCNN